MTLSRIAIGAAVVLIDFLLLGAFLLQGVLAVTGLGIVLVWTLLTAPVWVALTVVGLAAVAIRKPFMAAYNSYAP